MKWHWFLLVMGSSGCSTLLGVDYGDATLSTDDGADSSACGPAACGGQCGAILDACGAEVRCTECPSGETCGAGGPNRCGPGSCTARTCDESEGGCGRISDGCGQLLECPPCPEGPTPCALPWNASLYIEQGASHEAFERAEVPFGESCVSERRTCNAGVLSGSFEFERCQVAPPAPCPWQDGQLEHGQSTTAFAAAQVAWNAQCSSERRTCDNGTLSGSHAHASCAPARPPGFSCADPEAALGYLVCGDPLNGPFYVHVLRCAGNHRIVASESTSSVTFNYTGGTQSFSVPCVPGGPNTWTVTCQPIGTTVIRCHEPTTDQTFELPQLAF